MKTFNQLLSDYKTISRDSSSDNEAFGKQLLIDYIRELLYMEDWTFNRGSATDETVADQQYYPLPYNCWRIRSVKVEVSSTIYPLQEVKDENEWTRLNSVEVSSDVPTHFFIKPSTNEIGIYPIPSSDGNTITYSFQKRVPDYGETDYSTGTVSVTNGSTAVTGSGTTFTSDMVGRYIKVNKYWYKISSVTDNTHLTLLTEYGESTESGASYTISELVPILEGFENVPLYRALEVYFNSRENPVQADRYKILYQNGLSNLYKRDSKTTGDVLLQSEVIQKDPNNWPEMTE